MLSRLHDVARPNWKVSPRKATATALAALIASLSPIAATAAVAAEPQYFTVLQLNLCNSGIAACYDGGESIPEAKGLIESTTRPSVVTLNEVCKRDVAEIAKSMGSVENPREIAFHFTPALERDTRNPVRCTNGDEYGIGIIAKANWGNSWGAYVYEAQDGGNERRAYACLHASNMDQSTPNWKEYSFYACATHLSGEPSVALKQCKELKDKIIPEFKEFVGVDAPVVIGGDFNLKPLQAKSCVPGGHYRKGDADVQHIILDKSFTFVNTAKIPLNSTDHPAFSVRANWPWHG